MGVGAFVVSAIVKMPGVPRGQPPGWLLIILSYYWMRFLIKVVVSNIS